MPFFMMRYQGFFIFQYTTLLNMKGKQEQGILAKINATNSPNRQTKNA